MNFKILSGVDQTVFEGFMLLTKIETNESIKINSDKHPDLYKFLYDIHSGNPLIDSIK